MALHWHVEFELIRILSGSLKLTVDEEEYTAKAGSSCFIPSGTIHAGVKKLRLMTYTVYKNGWVSVDPFAGFHVKPTYAERRYLPCNWSSRSS